MPRLALHSFRNQKTLLTCILVFVVLFSVSFAWHDTYHASNNAQECDLCLSSLDFEHSIPQTVIIFEPNFYSFSFITSDYQNFYSVFVAITGNRDPPAFIFN